MPLTYDLSHIENRETVCYVPDPEDPAKRILNPITEAIIFRTMVVDMGKITFANVDEFVWRLWAYDMAFERPIVNTLANPMKRRSLYTYEEIIAHVGLVTNVSYIPLPRWKKRLMDMIDREVKEDIRRAKMKLQAKANENDPTHGLYTSNAVPTKL